MNFQLFTSTCQICNKRIINAESLFCTECFGKLPKTHFQFSNDNIIKDKFQGNVALAYAGAYVYYREGNIMKQILWEMKYNQNRDIAIEIGKLAGMESKIKLQENIDIIIPIPLHPYKLQIRGYNQAELIGQGMSEITGIPLYNNVLSRSKNTNSQTKLNRDQRFENLNHAFELQNQTKIKDKRVLLIDDVITTGATLSVAASHLIDSEIKNLSIYCLATAFEI